MRPRTQRGGRVGRAGSWYQGLKLVLATQLGRQIRQETLKELQEGTWGGGNHTTGDRTSNGIGRHDNRFQTGPRRRCCKADSLSGTEGRVRTYNRPPEGHTYRAGRPQGHQSELPQKIHSNTNNNRIPEVPREDEGRKDKGSARAYNCTSKMDDERLKNVLSTSRTFKTGLFPPTTLRKGARWKASSRQATAVIELRNPTSVNIIRGAEKPKAREGREGRRKGAGSRVRRILMAYKALKGVGDTHQQPQLQRERDRSRARKKP